MGIKEGFDAVSAVYDRQRRQLIPGFDDFYGWAAEMVRIPGGKPRILDLGAGTGLLTSFIAQKYPDGHFTLVDLSEKMLAVAQERFAAAGISRNCEYISSDFIDYPFGDDTFDAVVSALSIHHLTDGDKERLYRKCYHMLRPGGVFVNADQVQAPFPAIENHLQQVFRDKIERSGLTAEEIAQAYERTSFDKPATLARQLDWLREAGFTETDCVYKNGHFAVMYARK